MRLVRVILPVFWCVVVGITLSSMTTPTTAANSAAAPVCTIMSQADLKTAKDACSQADGNTVCLGQNGVNATLTDASTALKARGDQVDLSKVKSLITSVTDPASGVAGVAMLKFPGDQPVTGVLFGDAKLTFTGTTTSQATAAATQDARTATEQVQSTDSGVPAFTLDTAATAKISCTGLSSGLLVQSDSKTTSHLIVNSADVAFDTATLLLRATPQDRLEVAAIAGKATVTAAKKSVTVDTGNWVRVRLSGTDGLTAKIPPPAPTSYTFAALDNSPLSFLPTAVTCTVGLPANSTTRVSVRVGPGTERGPLFFMTPDQNFTVKGQGKDSSGALWWQINADKVDEAWVAQSDVHSAGTCDQVAQATPPPVRVAVPQAPADNGQSSGTVEPISRGFAPSGRTIWQATVGPLSTSGICNKIPPAYCDQLVQLTPSGSGILWKGQELQPYYMTRIRENVYSYSGPNPLGDARLTLTLEFTSQTGFRATQVMTPNDDPQCKDTFSFSGEFLR